MLQLITAGIALGFIGSFHCVGMCGPLALSLPIASTNSLVRFLGTLLYNAGRIVTYSLLGLLFGFIGRSVAVFGFQQWLSVIMGLLILLFLLIGKRFNTTGAPIPLMNKYYKKIRASLGKLYAKQDFATSFLIGSLNGLLPCGLVYMAAAGALATGNIINSITFMTSFGLGTLPAMWAVAFFGNYLAAGIRQRIRRAQPYVIGLLACLLILRGMGLGIPYISPQLNDNKREMRECYKP